MLPAVHITVGTISNELRLIEFRTKGLLKAKRLVLALARWLFFYSTSYIKNSLVIEHRSGWLLTGGFILMKFLYVFDEFKLYIKDSHMQTDNQIT